MSERIKELAEQAGVTFDSLGASYTSGSLLDILERFPELVRQDEREACAKLCDGLSGRSYEFDMGRLHSANAIRARGEK